MCGCLLPRTCVESARVLHVQTRSQEEAEKRKAESQDLRAHRKTAVWSQTRSARPPHTADELCPHCSPLPAPLLNGIHLLWVWCLTLKVTTLFSTQGTLKGSIYIRLMMTALFLFASKLRRCAVIAGCGPVLPSRYRNNNYYCLARESLKFFCAFMINNEALFTFSLWSSKLFPPKQRSTYVKK